MTYEIDITSHAQSDIRLESLFYIDDLWLQSVVKQALEEAGESHTIHPQNVHFNIERSTGGGKKYVMRVDSAKKKENQAVAVQLPMIFLKMEIMESHTLSEAEAIANMLLDSGLTMEEVDEMVGAPNWRTEEIRVNYA
jgi:hypothetical protein